MKRKGLSMGQFADWDVGADYECIKILGQGSYGAVASAIHKPSGKKVAIKKMDGLFEDEVDCKRILREVAILERLKHPYIIELFDIVDPKDKETFDTLYVVLELAESDLKKVIKSAIHLQLKHIQTVVYNLLCAIKYLHTGNVIHRDLKPANVLVNEDCSVKICDFGLARSLEGVHQSEMLIKGRKFAKEDHESKAEDAGHCTPIEGSVPAKITPADKSDKDLVESANLLSLTACAAPSAEEEKKEQSAEDKRKELTSRLIKTKDQRKNMKRELTGHVVTRWYRAPELILLEKDYGPAIDMWSVGCIFAELLGMMKESAPTYLDRKPLFPGKSCFPLSPDKHAKAEKGGFPVAKNDQLAVIFEVIGSPTEEDKSFVTDTKAQEYLSAFSDIPKTDLSKMYPGAGEEAIDLLDKMLMFNPYYRVSVEDALNHNFFKKVKKTDKEQVADHTVALDFEKEGALDKKRLRELFLSHISEIKKLPKHK